MVAKQGGSSQPAAAPKAPTAPLAPAGQTPATAGSAPSLGGGPGSAGALNVRGKSYSQLRAMFDELSGQRQTLANRRDGAATAYERASGASREGIGSRLTTLDGNIVTIEQELQQVGQQMAEVKPASNFSGPPINYGMNPGDVFGISILVFLGTVLTMVPLAVRRAKARWARMGGTGDTPMPIPGSNQRLERIEQAVDSIAIEIERVSENQRFMTRLMTETQLAGTIAAVRSSTEMAKSVAEEAK
jgi:hypothetical protein